MQMYMGIVEGQLADLRDKEDTFHCASRMYKKLMSNYG